MAKAWSVLGCVGVAAMALGGCDDTSRSNQCSRICEKRELCDSETDENQCVNDCLSRDYLSSEYVAFWAECVAPSAVSCNFAMDDDAVDDCVADQLRAEPTPPLVDDVCRAMSSKLAACSEVEPLSIERQCRRGDSLKLSADYLEKSRECVDALCEVVEECFDDLADDYNTTLSILPAAAGPAESAASKEESASGLAGQVEDQAKEEAEEQVAELDAGVSLEI